MGSMSLQVCMDSCDWLQGTMNEETGLLETSSPSGGSDPMLACSRPLMERRLRPPHDQSLKCPRCDSTHTKFCYYNNYSLSQPRYFCKTCRRYWTKGGTLRNIPVGGGCRKNKKISSNSKKPAALTATTPDHNIHHQQPNPHGFNPNPIVDPNPLSYQESPMQFSAYGATNNPSFMFENLDISATRAIDFMESNNKYEAAANHFMGMMGSGTGTGYGVDPSYNHGSNLFSPLMTLDGINSSFMERGMIGYNGDHDNVMNSLDVKPKILALEWQDQTGCSSGHGAGQGKNDSFGYVTGLGSSWSGLMNGYGPSTTNPLV